MDTNSKESVFNEIICLMDEMIKEISADRQQHWINKSKEVLQQLKSILLNDDDSEIIPEQHQKKGINLFLFTNYYIVFFILTTQVFTRWSY
jgi:hypothetical protein